MEKHHAIAATSISSGHLGDPVEQDRGDDARQRPGRDRQQGDAGEGPGDGSDVGAGEVRLQGDDHDDPEVLEDQQAQGYPADLRVELQVLLEQLHHQQRRRCRHHEACVQRGVPRVLDAGRPQQLYRHECPCHA
ncbi:MAG: hypothetical protein M5U09_10270 [Gammaproteobacteria bacterium]|nr:hypothetical protein [Gammaproteobacteria bacterium]